VIDGPSREFDDSTLGAIGLLGSENKFLVAVSRVGIELWVIGAVVLSIGKGSRKLV